MDNCPENITNEILEKQIKHDSENRRFFIKMKDESMSLLDYSISDNQVMNIHHTETPPQWRGKGLAAALVFHAATFALKKKMKINAICWYADKILKDQPKFKHLLQ
uniref:Protein NATD1 n=1 Tax=Parastrongyloides trichosuri TaxID=131310 RepID=A0A0N4Z3B7_PARTI